MNCQAKPITARGGGNDDNRVKDETQTYVFPASGYTYTYTNSWVTITGSYAYDSTRKEVYLSRSTIDGKDRAAYYAAETADSGHPYVDNNACRAAYTNGGFGMYGGGAFPFYPFTYNSANKTIDLEH